MDHCTFGKSNNKDMRYLTTDEQTKLIQDCMRDDGMSRSKDTRMAAFIKAAEKFGLKISHFKKGTYFEEVVLKTNYNNYDAVWEFISGLGVSVMADCGTLKYCPNK